MEGKGVFRGEEKPNPFALAAESERIEQMSRAVSALKTCLGAEKPSAVLPSVNECSGRSTPSRGKTLNARTSS